MDPLTNVALGWANTRQFDIRIHPLLYRLVGFGRDTGRLLRVISAARLKLLWMAIPLLLQSCSPPPPAVVKVTVPAGYHGALLVIEDPECVRENFDPANLDFTYGPIICVPSLRPYESWHTLQGTDANGAALAIASRDTMTPGNTVLVEMGAVTGLRFPTMLQFYFGDPANADGAFRILEQVDFSKIQEDPWLLRHP